MKSLAAVTSCLSDYDPNALPLANAARILSDFIAPITDHETLDLRAALGRIAATDVLSPIAVPAHDNSAMDGYALRGDDLPADAAKPYRIVGTAFAGKPYSGAVGIGECVRIMTGAVMPRDCDTVVPQEVAQSGNGRAFLPAGLKRGQHRRLAGEDLKAGVAAIAAGRVLTPSDLGLAASLGIATLSVARRARVAFFSTGDELRSIGEPLEAGCVYDSNRYTLYGMLNRLGVDAIDLGVVRDDPAALEAALRRACDDPAIAADAIITSGGVSVGEADYTKEIMERLGDVAFWKIAMKPGRPMAFGRVKSGARSAILFGLPGNPVAVMVTFYALVRDALMRLASARATTMPTLSAICDTPLKKNPGRTEYQRGIATRATDGWHVRVTGAQGSGILRSMSEANCLIVLPHERGSVDAGDVVDALPFEGLV